MHNQQPVSSHGCRHLQLSPYIHSVLLDSSYDESSSKRSGCHTSEGSCQRVADGGGDAIVVGDQGSSGDGEHYERQRPRGDGGGVGGEQVLGDAQQAQALRCAEQTSLLNLGQGEARALKLAEKTHLLHSREQFLLLDLLVGGFGADLAVFEEVSRREKACEGQGVGGRAG